MEINLDIITFLDKYNLDESCHVFINSKSDIIETGIFKKSKISKYSSFRNLIQITKSSNIDKISFIFTDKIYDLSQLIFDFDIIKHTEYIYISAKEESKTHQELMDFLIGFFPKEWQLVNNFNEYNFLFKNVSYRDSLILKSGAWNTKDMNEHVFDDTLAEGLLNIFNDNNIKTIVDFGCGPGEYVRFFKNNKFDIDGYDGNPNTIVLSNGLCKILDLTKNIKLDKKFDCVLSLEVGEHIPKEYEQIYINNLVENSNNYVIISWAIPEQGGYGHVNCQTNEYIKKEFNNRAFISCEKEENLLRESAKSTWFKDTIMVFKKVNN